VCCPSHHAIMALAIFIREGHQRLHLVLTGQTQTMPAGVMAATLPKSK
jgi:hypothetical protein